MRPSQPEPQTATFRALGEPSRRRIVELLA